MADAFSAVGMTGLTGLDQCASLNQLDRSAITHAGHTDAASLAHLTQALYIPRHDKQTAQFPVANISAQYAAATGRLALGSSQYVVALGVMQKPPREASASYEVSGFTRTADEMVGSVRAVSEATGVEVKPLPEAQNKEKAAILRPSGGSEIPLTVTYPIRASVTRDGTFQHPYFTFQLPGESATFTWEIHPSEQGRMRYTLVRRPASQEQQAGDGEVEAVYHHIGVGASLSLPYSEGVLLLPGGTSLVRASLVVSSALGMLWRLRELHGGGGEGSKKKSRLGRLFRRME